jgi:hypothetical protein
MVLKLKEPLTWEKMDKSAENLSASFFKRDLLIDTTSIQTNLAGQSL